MWRHYQTTHSKQEKWKACDESRANEVALDEATHMAMLCTNVVPEEGADYSQAKYFGDMVIDIDHGDTGDNDPDRTVEALNKSIVSANLIVDALATKIHSTDQLKIYVTGKKGFHIHIPWQLIHTTKTPSHDLPTQYKYIAQRLEIETGATGIDYSLYAKQKGHLVRIPNKQRPEGTYKVQISASDLKIMTVETYRQFASHPRPALQSPKLTLGIGLVGLLQAAKNLPAKPAQSSGISDEMLEGLGTEKHPECVIRMMHGSHQKSDVNFNALAIQMSVYIRAASVPASEKDILLTTFAAHNTSSTYRTPEARVRHVELEAGPYVQSLPFSCQAMRGSVDMIGGCTGCPVQAKISGDLKELTRITEDDQGISYVSLDGVPRRLTSFNLDLEDVFSPPEHQGRMTNMWFGGMCAISQNGVHQATIPISTSVFVGAKEFHAEFGRYRDGFIDLTDKDVKLIERYLLGKVKGKQGMRTTASIGVRAFKYIPDDSDQAVDAMMWVEDGWSLSSQGLTGGVKLQKPIDSALKHEYRAAPRTADKAMADTLLRLLGSSEPTTVGLLLGWVCAAQLKEHIIDRVQEFPLLHLVGTAGAGKTSLAKVFATMGSADYRTITPPTVSGMSPAALRELSYQSTTVPRILDECSKGKMATQKWNVVREMLKSCYQRSSIAIGGISNKKQIYESHSVKVFSEQASSPIIYMSTTETDEAELWERSIEVKLNKNSHHVGNYKKNFVSIKNHPKQWAILGAWSKVLMRQSLATKPDDAYERYEHFLEMMPEHFDDRIQNSFAWIFFGLDFLRTTLTTIGYTGEVLAELDNIQKKTWEWLEEKQVEIHRKKSRTEVDNFFEKLIQTAARIDVNGNPGLRKGVHYIRIKNALYLNSESVISEYRMTCRLLGQNPEFSSAEQIRSAIDGQNYFLGEEKIPGLSGFLQSWLKFDIDILEERGNGCSRFEEN